MSDKTPTKAELFAEIEKLAAELGKPVPEGLTNVQQHFDALEALTGKPDPRRPPKPGAGAVRASEPPVSSAPPPPAPPEKDEEEKGPPPEAEREPAPEVPPVKVSPSGRWRVAEGKLVVCAAGKVGAFQEIRAVDVGGQEALDELIASGTVVPVKR